MLHGPFSLIDHHLNQEGFLPLCVFYDKSGATSIKMRKFAVMYRRTL